MKEQIEQKLIDTRAQLTAFLEQANRQVGLLQGAIAAYEQLLVEMAEEAPVDGGGEQ